jgi:hypothetical protein
MLSTLIGVDTFPKPTNTLIQIRLPLKNRNKTVFLNGTNSSRSLTVWMLVPKAVTSKYSQSIKKSTVPAVNNSD